MQDIHEVLRTIVDETRVLKSESMKKHTTFKIGGPAEYYIIVNTIEELKDILKLAKKEKVQTTIIGNGSNILVKDGGIRGFVLKINFTDITFEDGNIINIGSGVLLSKLANEAQKKNLTGLEFACGIPGTIGGAIKMNAGAYGSEIKDVILDVTYLDKDLGLKTINNENVEFKYRKTRFTENEDDIIVSTRLLLQNGNNFKIKELMDEYKKARRSKQPIELPSAGSTFKRGSNFMTAQVIDELGLKGFRIGDAQISTKHAGFIVNIGNATANDVLNLVKYIQKKVQEEYAYKIDLEIEVLGED